MRNCRFTACCLVFCLSVATSVAWARDIKKEHETDTDTGADTASDASDASVDDTDTEDAGISDDAGDGGDDTDTSDSTDGKKDKDKDGIPDDEDNCPDVANPDQEISACAEDSYLGGAFSCDCSVAPGRGRAAVGLILSALMISLLVIGRRRF